MTGNLVSPDGMTIIVSDNQRKQFLYPVEGGEPKVIPSLNGGEQIIRWTADGRSVYVFNPSELPLKISLLNLSSGKKELWKEVSPSDPAGIFGPSYFFITPDGKGYVYGLRRYIFDLFVAEGLK